MRRAVTLAVAAALALGAAAPSELDAAKLTCARFAELGKSRQQQVLSFLQGYAQREVAADKVGSVAIGAGLPSVLEACASDPAGAVWPKVQTLATGTDAAARGDARLTRQPTEITCAEYVKLSRDDQRLTVYWLDGYSRKVDASDANQSVVALRRGAEDVAKNACGKRKQRLWWAIQGGVRSVAPARGK